MICLLEAVRVRKHVFFTQSQGFTVWLAEEEAINMPLGEKAGDQVDKIL
jgi:hypothetical protein